MIHLTLLLLYLLYLNNLYVTREDFGQCNKINVNNINLNTVENIGNCIDDGLTGIYEDHISKIDDLIVQLANDMIKPLKRFVKIFMNAVRKAVDAFVKVFSHIGTRSLKGTFDF